MLVFKEEALEEIRQAQLSRIMWLDS